MDEPYRIEVLHIVNPHVIFVESRSQKGGPVIQQVGLYGVLPVNKTIDIDGQVVTERCENWPVAANTILREFLADHTNGVYFLPIEVDERSTIFDENVYQFGDIIVETGKRISVIDHLIDLSVADKDESIFHQKLASGIFKTKLNMVRTEEVLDAIKKYYQKQKTVRHDWQKTINTQTSVYQESKKMTMALTEKNLKLFERNSYCPLNVMETIERKEKDSSLCKDADLISVGCGVKRNRTSRTSSAVPIAPQNIEVLEEKKAYPHDILNNMKRYLNANCQTKDSKDKEYVSQDYGVKRSTPERDYGHIEKSYVSQDENQVLQPKSKGDGQLEKLKINMNSVHQQYDDTDDQQEHSSNHSQIHSNPHVTLNHGVSEFTRRRISSGRGRNADRSGSSNYHQKSQRTDSEISENRYDLSADPAQYKEEKTSPLQESPNKVTKPLKPRERRYVFCPDMEMSHENIKNFRPITVVEGFSKDHSETNVHVKENENGYPIEYDKADKTTHNNNKTLCQTSHSVAQNQTKINSAKTNRETQLVSSILKRKLQALKNAQKRLENSFSSNSDTSVKDTSSSAEQSKIELDSSKTEVEMSKIELGLSRVGLEMSSVELETLEVEAEPPVELIQPKFAEDVLKIERNANPFKNLDGSKSVFVEKLISPILMVHTKNDNLILPHCDLRDIPFKQDIHVMLRNMRVQKPKRLQTVTWSYILRGHSVFMVGPASNGKTLGYVPAVCNLVIDSKPAIDGVGPICIIVCATSLSVAEVESYCKRFLSVDERIVSFFSGIDPSKVMTALLNGCHILICTAPALVHLLETDFGVDLRRLMVLVLDDCERLSQVYASELNKILHNVKSMLKNRADKSLKVQYVVASRQWCDFMTPLAKKAPDTVIAIGASQECVLYSKTKTSVNYVKSQISKVNSVIEFLEETDRTKQTVIVCRADDEVVLLENTLTALKHTVFACNSTMTLHDLYKLNETWANYQEPILGPILICCDGNLTHLNITNANYLIHFSLPAMFSMFCKRFSVLNENYASIFGPANEDVKIKILLDETNVEQLPKILHFVKRCTKEAYPMLDNVLQEVLEKKDLKKAEKLNPICNNLMMLGECIDVWNCPDRHTVFKEYDNSPDWIPKQGLITFKIMHYDSAVTYSARLLSKVTKSGTIKYPNNYNTLSLKMGMYYSKESNRKLQGMPKLGDVCAVALKQNFFERCKVMRVIPGDNEKSCHVLINLIDEEKLTITSDVNLYYLPDDLKAIETHVVKVRLANIQPKDKDVTFSLAAQDCLQKITDRDRDNVIYLKGRVVMTLGNCIFIDTAEACVDLSSLGETVVKSDFKKSLLCYHAEPNPLHIEKLKKFTGIVSTNEENEPEVAPKVKRSAKWAHLDKDDFSSVIFAAAIDADTVFVRHSKFQKVINLLQKDIEEYVEKASELAHEEIFVGNIVLAEFPDDKMYERARIDEVLDGKKVKCFFVDNGDWRQVPIEKLKPITQNIMDRIPFQAIECRLVGVKPPSNATEWPEFSTSWLYDNCFEDNDGNIKYLFLKYFTKEKAKMTGGHKYGVVLLDTYSNQDVVINKMMIDLNLAKEIEDEMKYIDEPLNVKATKATTSSDTSYEEDLPKEDKENSTHTIKDLVPLQSEQTEENYESNVPLHMLFGKPIRSVPLVNDSDSDVSDKWDVNVDKDLIGMFGQPSRVNVTEHIPNNDELTDSNNATKEASGSSTKSPSKVLKNREMSQRMLKSPSLESESDSDSDIGNERTKALDIFKSRLFKNDTTEKSLTNVSLVKREVNVENGDEKETPVRSKTETLDSDDFSSIATENQTSETHSINVTKPIEAVEPLRKPKLVWRQNKNAITMKINLIGVDDYVLDIKARSLRFQAWHNDISYDFDFELYGVVVPEKSAHSNKGQYIQVKLIKMLHRKWLNLTKEFSAKKWIVYDVDAIDFSTDDDDDHGDEARKAIKQNHENVESATEDEDFADDMNFRYKKY